MTRPVDEKSGEAPRPTERPKDAPGWDFGPPGKPAGSARPSWSDDDFARISGWVRGVSPPTSESEMPDWAKPDFFVPPKPRAHEGPAAPPASRARKTRKQRPPRERRSFIPDTRPAMRRMRMATIAGLSRVWVVTELIGAAGSAVGNASDGLARRTANTGRATLQFGFAVGSLPVALGRSAVEVSRDAGRTIAAVSRAALRLCVAAIFLPLAAARAGRAMGSTVARVSEHLGRSFAAGGRAALPLAGMMLAMLTLPGRVIGIAAAALAEIGEDAAWHGKAMGREFRHLSHVGAAALAAQGAGAAKQALDGGVDFFSRPDLRSAFLRVAAVAIVLGLGFGIAATTGPLPGVGISKVAMHSSAAKPPPVAVAMAIPAATVASEVPMVPLPMPRIAHRPRHENERRYAARGGSDADMPSQRPLYGSWQPMGGELARGRALSSPERIYEAQVRLSRLGYPAGPATGFINGQTRYAVALFQRDARLPMTGDIDGRFIRRLRIADDMGQRLAVR
jgi:hypothetical protein